MKTFFLTSSQFSGEIEFVYCPEGYLVFFEYRAQMTEDQRAWLLGNLPRHRNALLQLKAKSKTIILTEVKREVTFDAFWDKYDHKATSSKKKALAKWDRMPASEKVKAFNYISRYFAGIPAGVHKKNAETYLNSELWNN